MPFETVDAEATWDKLETGLAKGRHLLGHKNTSTGRVQVLCIDSVDLMSAASLVLVALDALSTLVSSHASVESLGVGKSHCALCDPLLEAPTRAEEDIVLILRSSDHISGRALGGTGSRLARADGSPALLGRVGGIRLVQAGTCCLISKVVLRRRAVEKGKGDLVWAFQTTPRPKRE